MYKRCSIRIIYITLIFVFQATAQLSVSTLEKYQVIPRTTSDNADYAINGTCSPGTQKILFTCVHQNEGTVVAQLIRSDLGATIERTSWKATLSSIPVGGEYSMHFYGINENDSIEDSITVEHILVGEIWLCAGQSNMLQKAPENPDPEHVHVRVLFQGNGPLTGIIPDTSSWTASNSPGPTMTFGAEMYKQTGIPIGIILGASGNTSINDWFAPPQRPLFTILKKMVTSICDFNISGFLWYQGENEDQQASWALGYYTKFISFRDTVRVLSHKKDLPVLAVQLESWDGGGKYSLPVERRPRWPIIRDQQERIGASDSLSATVPAWDFAGLHIDQASQGILGKRAAKIAVGNYYKKQSGTGPLFDSAWFTNKSRSKIVVKLTNLNGSIILPDDSSHLGFYVMKPDLFDIDNAAIFDYGATAEMLVPLKSVQPLDSNKVIIELSDPGTDSLTIGYGRHINLISLTPLTDNSGIPLCTFFNRPITLNAQSVDDSISVLRMSKRLDNHSVSYIPSGCGVAGPGGALQYKHPKNSHITLELFSINGKKIVSLVDGFSSAGEHIIQLVPSIISQHAENIFVCRFFDTVCGEKFILFTIR